MITFKNALLISLPILLFGCTELLELAEKPEVSLLRHSSLGTTNVSTIEKKDIVTPEEYKTLEADPNINVTSASLGFDYPYDKYHVSYIQTIYTSGPKGYYVVVENTGRDTAYNVYIGVPTNKGTFSIFTDTYFLPGEYDSSAIWFNDETTVVTGSPIVDYDSYTVD